MPNLRSQSAGGKATAILLHKNAIEGYNANPNLCKKCGKPILAKDNEKVSQVRKRVCCSSACWDHPRRKVHNKCPICQKEIAKDAKTCRKHKEIKSYIELGNHKTKKELFSKRNGYQSVRSSIRLHAQKTFEYSGLPKICSECGYSKHVDIAHRIPVSSFPNDATLGEINSIDNLIALCPNHHWEYDHRV